MKNRKAKKGFTIIELVIVIAVIGILAAVLIPTFSGVIEKANVTKAMVEARDAYVVYQTENDGETLKNIYIQSGNYYFQISADGQFNIDPWTASGNETKPSGTIYTIENGNLKAPSPSDSGTTTTNP